jgi:pimeloyl-[acyl-carrier protein] methyl ester esterase
VAALELDSGGLLEFDDSGTGPAIVFLHGWSLGKVAFSIQRQGLSDRFRVIVPDMRGHGHSAAFGPDDGIETLAGDLAALLAELGITDAILVGWSMGALVAWEMVRGPQRGRVKGIVTIDMVPKVLNCEDWPHGLRAGTHLYDVDIDLTRMRDDWAAFSRAYVPKVFRQDESADRSELIDKMSGFVSNNDVESMANLWTRLVEANYIETVQQLDIPTLITYGSHSQIYTEAAAKWMDDNIPNSRRVAFDDSGHAPHLEEPQKFNDALADFAESLFSN